jgi:hypothetical protein
LKLPHALTKVAGLESATILPLTDHAKPKSSLRSISANKIARTKIDQHLQFGN